jgi:RHS repeat-associated protein
MNGSEGRGRTGEWKQRASRGGLARLVTAVLMLFALVCVTGAAVSSGTLAEGVPGQDEGNAKLAATEPKVELPDERTATSDTYALPSGERETRVYQAPINYKTPAGEWRPIEEGFRREGSSIVNGANSFKVQLPDDLGSSPLRFSIGDDWISERPLGTTTEPASMGGTTARYRAESGGASFSFLPLADGVKEDIELAGPSAPDEYRFRLEASDDLKPEMVAGGAIDFRDPAGDLIAVIPAPVMFDSSTSPKISNAVRYELESVPGGDWVLTAKASREWLSNPDLSWPVKIDPTITHPSSALDCAYMGSMTSEGFSLCGPLLGGEYQPVVSGSDQWLRSAIRFDLSAIPKEASITAATLALHADSAASNTSGVEVREATKAWSNALNWRHATATEPWSIEGGDFDSEGSRVLTSERGSGPGWWYFEGLAGVAQTWLDLPMLNRGLILKLIDDHVRECGPSSCTQRSALFDGSASTEADRPYLAVTYVPPAPLDSKVSSPRDGTHSAKRFKLAASWSHAGVTGVSFQERGVEGEAWQTIPAGKVVTAGGGPVSWPIEVPEGAHESAPVYWNAIEGAADEQSKEIRAVLVGSPGAEGYTPGVRVVLDRNLGGSKDATTQVGPGTVDLLTGNLAVSRTDVSIPGYGGALEFGRAINSRDWLAEPFGLLGPGWVPSATVEAAGGSSWQKIELKTYTEEWEEEEYVGENEEGEEIWRIVTHSLTYHYALLTTAEGQTVAVEQNGSSFVMPAELSGWTLVEAEGGAQLILSEPGGGRTTFTKGSAEHEYIPAAYAQTGGPGNKTQMIYGFAEGARRLSLEIAPTAPGVECPPNESAEGHVGCRVLSFSYLPESRWGATQGAKERLGSITYWAATGPSTMGHWEVAKYVYSGAEGRLVEEWDPRLAPKELKESYTYYPFESGAGELHTITPPGQEPWTLEYGSAEGENPSGRLVAVKRASLLTSPTVAQTTIAYDVPLSAAGAPYEMSPAKVAEWGQQDAPMDATAVFPPDQVPSTPPSTYSHATVYYMDVEGQLVDTATAAGAGTSSPSIATTETNEFGDVVRELSAQNRIRALAEGSGKSAARANELSTKRVFSADGTELLEERGPIHAVRLESGSTVQARAYKTLEYDQGMTPGITPDPHLPTTETTGALVGATVEEPRVTTTGYNWNLRKPTTTTVDPGKTPVHLNIKTTTEYEEATGLPTERRQPSNPEGGKAGTTKTIYYSATGSGECVSVMWAGLPCQVLPAAQLEPKLLVTKYLAYNYLGEPEQIVESPGGEAGNTRKTITTYDAIGRTVTTKIEGGGTAITKSGTTETVYSPTLGLPTKQQFVCEKECTGFDTQATTTTYDALGRVKEYEDADGNKTTTTYDIDGRPSKVSDNKGIQTFHYDETSGLLTKLEDSGAGTFTGAYDADGNLVERTLPDGITAKTTYNEADEPTKLAYTKTSSCGTSCTWLEEGVERSINGQIISNTGNLVSDQYSYDKDGRLTQAEETPKGGSCTTRAYTFDADSNRLTKTTRAPGVGGACVTSGGTPQEYKYDAADRLLGEGLSYDSWGRITHLPGVDAGGHELITGYYSTNMVARQEQNGITNSYELDATGRQRARLQGGGGLEGTEVFHYDGPSDSPAWTERGTTWSRDISGIGGELVAIQESAGGVTFQLTDLHGDVVAAAESSPTATKLKATYRFDEFGEPESGGAGRFGWLGGKGRRTELSSGVIQMGARSYVPSLGRFLTPDPVPGGSANPYDYANQDPVNAFDLEGTCSTKKKCIAAIAAAKAKVRREIQHVRVVEHRTVEAAVHASKKIGFSFVPPVLSEVGHLIQSGVQEAKNVLGSIVGESCKHAAGIAGAGAAGVAATSETAEGVPEGGWVVGGALKGVSQALTILGGALIVAHEDGAC